MRTFLIATAPTLLTAWTLLTALMLLATGCDRGPKPTTYADTARYSFQLGQEALDDGDYLEAIRHFTQVKNKYAYSKYAALAELRIADAYYNQDKFVEAIDGYRRFMNGRPNHREVPYAMWRIAASYYEQLPSDFFLFPPPYEKDLNSTRDALRALQAFIERFPEHEKVPAAKERILACRRALADHELYVADFYLLRDHPASARGRLETLVDEFEDVPDRWVRAAAQLMRVYQDLGLPAEAKATARRLIEKHPEADEAASARALLRQQG